MRKWWVVWPLYAGLMGFALGASFFFALYGRNVTERSLTSQHEHASETAKSKKEESDEALAFYTLWLMGFTGVLAFATVGLGVATALLYATGEKQFRFAIRTSVKQSRDMQRSIAVADKSAKLAFDVERARIHIHNIVFDGSTEPSYPTVAFEIKNVGRTPAILILSRAKFEEIKGGVPEAVTRITTPFVLPFSRRVYGGKILNQNESMDGGPVQSAPLSGDKRPPWTRWVFRGEIVYQDIFGNEYKKVFTLNRNGQIEPVHSLTGPDHGQHNYEQRQDPGTERINWPT